MSHLGLDYRWGRAEDGEHSVESVGFAVRSTYLSCHLLMPVFAMSSLKDALARARKA